MNKKRLTVVGPASAAPTVSAAVAVGLTALGLFFMGAGFAVVWAALGNAGLPALVLLGAAVSIAVGMVLVLYPLTGRSGAMHRRKKHNPEALEPEILKQSNGRH